MAVFSLAQAQAQFYQKTNLVSDVAGLASHTDSHLVNPWGLSVTPSGPWWVSDEGTGVSTLYNADGSIVPLVVTIPPASGTGKGTPTGTVYQPVPGRFVFVTEDGTISSWMGGSAAAIQVNNSATATYLGCTLAARKGATLLYVANARGGIEAYDLNFKPVDLGSSAFVDPSLPAGFTPYNVQLAGARIYVTYNGPGNGFVDAYDVNGNLKLRLESGTFLSAPWGVALAPGNFGAFSNLLLIGNVGSGRIAVFNEKTGKFAGFVESAAKTPIKAPGMWALAFGNGGAAGPANTLFFTAGIRGYAHGLFGSITAK